MTLYAFSTLRLSRAWLAGSLLVAPLATPLVAPHAAHAQPSAQSLVTRGLRAPVSLTRDSAGIVHIEAQNEHDLFFAQGYSAARDRLFQLELWRRQATGTMAEALGPRWVVRDRAARLMRFRGDMNAELAHYHPRGKAIIQAFVDGVNAYVDRVRREPALLPPDLAALGITPGHWTPAVVVSRHNALASNASDEANLARAVRAIGGDAVARRRVFQPEPARLALDSLVAAFVGDVIDQRLLRDYNGSRSAPSFQRGEVGEAWRRAVAPDSTEPGERDVWESNNWVIAGSRTASGRPLVANDPHRSITVPSLRYLVHLKAPGWNVIGGGEPGIPGVAIGHNDHAAWGLTIFGIDSEDLYVYELDATNGAYRYRDAFVPFATQRDSIRVKGGATQTVTLQYTRHGPVLYVDSVRHRAVALRAGWLEVGGAPYLASLRLDQARTWEEARTALSYAHMPTLNWVWADTSGTIGWQTAGIAPVRRTWDGLMPVPGDGRFEWDGFLPIRQLPHESNPTRGYVGTANAFNVDPAYPRFDALARSWSDPFRHDRLQQVLDTTRRATVGSSGALQHDAVSLPARALVPLLREATVVSALAASPDSAALREIREALLAWDHTLTAESPAAAIYAVWERHLGVRVANATLPPGARGALRAVPLSRVVQWLTRPDSLLGPTPLATRDVLLVSALRDAVQELQQRFGSDRRTWRYGDEKLHHSRIQHPLHALLPDSLRRAWSPGPLPRGGYANTLLATSNADNQNHGASLRVVIDVGNWDSAIVTNTPGQSGDPRSPFYANLFPRWAANLFAPLPYSAAAVQAQTAEVVVLTP